jgi:hypothetical protein
MGEWLACCVRAAETGQNCHIQIGRPSIRDYLQRTSCHWPLKCPFDTWPTWAQPLCTTLSRARVLRGIPEDWVMGTRTETNGNTCENLRWVSQVVQQLELCAARHAQAVSGSETIRSKWRAFTLGTHIVHFRTERSRDCGSIRCVYTRYGEWAKATSDFSRHRIRPHNALLSRVKRRTKTA